MEDWKTERLKARGSRTLPLFHASILPALLLVLAAGIACGGEVPDEFRVRREKPFKFAEKPVVKRAGDKVTVAFAAEAACDATVAIEDARGKIVRHLACGVLGENAPAPFAKGTLKQTLVWDGKDDAGRYIDDKEGLSVRVSLGLAPRFERTLFWHPERRAARFPPLMAAAPEGVYVFDGGNAVDHLRLFDHDGKYLRTVYPFPAEKISAAKGLMWHVFPQDGKRLPVKPNFLQTSMLTSGTNTHKLICYKPEKKVYRSVVGASNNAHYGMHGGAGAALAVSGKRIALTHLFLNRLATDGSTGGVTLTGPPVHLQFKNSGRLGRGSMINVSPRSAALSPDGRKLYLTGFVFAGAIGKASADIVINAGWDAFHAVTVLDVEKSDPPQVFVGSIERGKHGSGPKQFKVPTSVCTDSKGRGYVSDYLNDRVQVFSPDGKLVKSVKVRRPARVQVHRRSGEIYVFSWKVMTYLDASRQEAGGKPTLTRLGPLPEARKIASYSLKLKGVPSKFNARFGTTFNEYFAELDSWAKEPTLWMVQEWAMSNVLTRRNPEHSTIVILGLEDDKLVMKHSFGAKLSDAKVKTKLHSCNRQRLNVNPATGRLFLTEGDAFNDKAFKQAYEIYPETGKVKVRQLPFDAEDMCFDMDGRAYLRTVRVVARYDPKTWREVPWDYGEKRPSVHTSSSGDRRVAAVISGLPLPADGHWHHGGMYVSPRGRLLVVCGYHADPKERAEAGTTTDETGKKWTPKMYPGRVVSGRGGGPFFHVWDRHGKLVHEDAMAGLGDTTYGVGLDSEDNLYMMAAATRVRGGKLHFNDMTGTLMKFKVGKGRIHSTGRMPMPLPEHEVPKRSPDLRNAAQGSGWVEGAEWFYGGVGWGGKNRGIGCACFNARFTLDYFNRSFAPELDRYSVAVLDSAGNVIMRVGTYGNVDDGKPLVPEGGPPVTRAIGGDEVALFHGAYLATHTDRRLFIADPGNGRVLSIRLNYTASETVNLKDVPDSAAP
ncbi:MAG: NHL repeat-containing protein [Planctomycetota bacterium]|jgi:hypothetical protein